jgi:hypothetical protein
MDCDGTSALHQRNKAVAAAEMRKSENRRRLEGNYLQRRPERRKNTAARTDRHYKCGCAAIKKTQLDVD